MEATFQESFENPLVQPRLLAISHQLIDIHTDHNASPPPPTPVSSLSAACVFHDSSECSWLYVLSLCFLYSCFRSISSEPAPTLSSVNRSQKQITPGPCQPTLTPPSPPFNLSFVKPSSQPNSHQLVLWCSWLSLLSNTQAVPGSNPGGIIAFACLVCLFGCLRSMRVLGLWSWRGFEILQKLRAGC